MLEGTEEAGGGGDCVGFKMCECEHLILFFIFGFKTLLDFYTLCH